MDMEAQLYSTLISAQHECICPHPYQRAIHNHPFNFSFHVNYTNDTVALYQTIKWNNVEMLVYILCPCFVHVLG
jgi:hypothetical protein